MSRSRSFGLLALLLLLPLTGAWAQDLRLAPDRPLVLSGAGFHQIRLELPDGQDFVLEIQGPGITAGQFQLATKSAQGQLTLLPDLFDKTLELRGSRSQNYVLVTTVTRENLPVTLSLRSKAAPAVATVPASPAGFLKAELSLPGRIKNLSVLPVPGQPGQFLAGWQEADSNRLSLCLYKEKSWTYLPQPANLPPLRPVSWDFTYSGQAGRPLNLALLNEPGAPAQVLEWNGSTWQILPTPPAALLPPLNLQNSPGGLVLAGPEAGGLQALSLQKYSLETGWEAAVTAPAPEVPWTDWQISPFSGTSLAIGFFESQGRQPNRLYRQADNFWEDLQVPVMPDLSELLLASTPQTLTTLWLDKLRRPFLWAWHQSIGEWTALPKPAGRLAAPLQLTAVDNLLYLAGPGADPKTLQIQKFDGKAWISALTAGLPAPLVGLHGYYLPVNQSLHLFALVQNPGQGSKLLFFVIPAKNL